MAGCPAGSRDPCRVQPCGDCGSRGGWAPVAGARAGRRGGDSGDCLEVKDTCTACVPVRESKNPHGPAVVFAATARTPFVTAAKGDSLV
ncbi:DUF397 domain-containing protein [Streptomyces sp. NPDC051644]|uniref:DUF397 domain-containing protein n=1 Tax=Streptomyces sp. NPDC051644 TaxID=3365666 RepID=UPI0037A4F8AF